jgi:hypothetical protein
MNTTQVAKCLKGLSEDSSHFRKEMTSIKESIMALNSLVRTLIELQDSKIKSREDREDKNVPFNEMPFVYLTNEEFDAKLSGRAFEEFIKEIIVKRYEPVANVS